VNSEQATSWEQCNLGKYVRLIRGVSYKKNRASEKEGKGLIPILRATNISKELTFDDLIFVPEDCVSSDQLLRPGDIVLAASSGSLNIVGKAAPLKSDWHGSFGAFCFCLRPGSSVVPEYVSYFLQTAEYRSAVSRLAGGSNINNLKQSHIREFPFRLPRLHEQRRIVAKIEELFSDLDAGVAALERVRANLKRYRASVLKAAVEGRLTAEWREEHKGELESASELLKRILVERRRKWEETEWRKLVENAQKKAAQKRLGVRRVSELKPEDWQNIPKSEYAPHLPKNDKWKAKYKEPEPPDASDLPELPEGWRWTTVEQIAASEANAITDGPFGSHLKTSHYTTSGPRVIRLQNIGDGVFVDEVACVSADHYKRLLKHRICAEDIVIAALGETLPRACIIPDFVGPAIVKADCIRLKVNPFIVSKFILVGLNAMPTRRRAKNIVHGVGRPRLNLGEIKGLALPLAPMGEQHQIVTEVDRRLSVADEVEAQIEADLKRAARLRQAILKRAFEGRLVPQVSLSDHEMEASRGKETAESIGKR
jgi:type I restriction enzyme S subunit